MVGRRQPTYTLPFQDKGVLHSDLGREPREVRVEALLLGTDYRAQRDRLIAALEAAGPATLYTPETGSMLCVIGKGSRAQVKRDQRMTNGVRVSFSVKETFDQPPQEPRVDTAAAAQSATAQARVDLASAFANPRTGLKTPIVSDFVKAAHLDVLDEVVSTLRGVNAEVSSVLSVPSGVESQINALEGQLSTLVTAPAVLFASISSVFESLADAAVSVLDLDGEDREARDASLPPGSRPLQPGQANTRALRTVGRLTDGHPDVPDIDTAERRDQAQGQRAIRRHVKALGVMHLGDAATETEYTSAVDAIAARDAIINAALSVIDSEPDLESTVAGSLRTATAALAAHLTATAGTLSTLTSHTPVDTLPAEVVAHKLYGDAERADGIVLRNSIARPLFVQGKVELEVESR